MRTATIYNYTITEQGKVYNTKTGKEIKIRHHRNRLEIQITTPEGRKYYPLARLIYYAFNPKFDITDQNQCITFKDNNKLNCHIDNLANEFRGNLIQGDGHKSINRITTEQAEQIKHDYLETINNRPVNQFDRLKPYNSYRELAKKYNVTYPLIKQIIEGKTRDKSKYKLKKGV